MGEGDFNIAGNSYRDGPAATLIPFWFDPENSPPPSRYWVSNNYVDDPGIFVGYVDDPYTTPGFDVYSFACCGIGPGQFNTEGEFDSSGFAGYVPITTEAPLTAHELVLDHAGAWPRDIVNQWAVDESRARTGTWGDRRPADWLEGLTPGTPPVDVDRDGIADSWELANGLNPADSADHTTVMPSGYTAIETYINELADQQSNWPVFVDGFETGDTSGWGFTEPCYRLSASSAPWSRRW